MFQKVKYWYSKVFDSIWLIISWFRPDSDAWGRFPCKCSARQWVHQVRGFRILLSLDPRLLTGPCCWWTLRRRKRARPLKPIDGCLPMIRLLSWGFPWDSRVFLFCRWVLVEHLRGSFWRCWTRSLTDHCRLSPVWSCGAVIWRLFLGSTRRNGSA